MSTNNKGQKLVSLVPGWNRTVTLADVRDRNWSRKPPATRQVSKQRLFAAAMSAVNKADAKRCEDPKEKPQLRRQRRDLARAYTKAALLKRSN